MSDPTYGHIGKPLDRLAEECAEVIMACMKIARFGIDNHHPITLEGNRAMLAREILDLETQIAHVRRALASHPNKLLL